MEDTLSTCMLLKMNRAHIQQNYPTMCGDSRMQGDHTELTGLFSPEHQKQHQALRSAYCASRRKLQLPDMKTAILY